MCGIVGYIGTQAAKDILLDGLQNLEYRGYDSAGIVTARGEGLHCVRVKGKMYQLREKLAGVEDGATVGIGHTRWATHGKPEERNAHPHCDGTGRVAVVQNGIVENYRSLRDRLKQQGCTFVSDTDTEVIPHTIGEYLKKPDTDLLAAVRLTIAQLEGAFAIAVVAADAPDEIVVARQQVPIVLGFGQGEFFCASDTPAIIAHTRAVLNLENGEMAKLTPLGIEIYDFAGKRLKKTPRILDWTPAIVEKQGFRHFMHKEIHEQPGVLRACWEAYFPTGLSDADDPIRLAIADSNEIERVQIVACGTSWHAGLVGQYLIEQLAGIPARVQYASEFRYAPAPLMPRTLTIGVTQSGETADTLAALSMEIQRRAGSEEELRSPVLGITNRPESSLGSLVAHLINTHAGVEIGVAATKSFTGQLAAFYALALALAHQRQTVPRSRIERAIEGLRQLPAHIETTIAQQEKTIQELAHRFGETQDFIYLGRGINFPIALEGALKLKEISYIHAEGYPAGEMKHGPIALLDSKVPVVAIAMPGAVYDKVLSNAQEAKARDSLLIGIAPADSPHASETFDILLPVPAVDEILSPILTVIPLQLLAYHIAALRGLDVDQPRNLAKSVTVE